jgi:8-oxo-dGTP pyrophosphatase MutT (NUDIX family)
MPAFTTNVEFGWWFQSGKIVFGAPPEAPKNRYLVQKAKEMAVPIASTLEGAVIRALEMVSDGDFRADGECHVPLYIWKTPSFQSWYTAQKQAGNRLDGAKVEWTFRVGPNKKFVFFWVLHVDVYIASEDRHKTNEVVISRPDISTVLIYHPGETLYETRVILVREFRSPASNTTGFVWEIAGGSSFKPVVDPYTLAAHEVDEEVGLTINPANVKKHEARQMVATLSAHKAHLFSVEISDEQLNWLQSQIGIAKGVVEDTERTYTEIQTIGEILDQDKVDWSMLGMILSVLTPLYNK